ncbi:MAG: DUF1501 domain-containing protein [Proteobacteria bacterium]|nr:DUF1501 domain-containing protein [Pseudomonadota bacterium]
MAHLPARVTRRTFLRSTGLVAALGAMPALARAAAAAASGPGAATDYKALVCIFLQGGNDGHNLVIPTGGSEWSAYATFRGAAAVAPDQLLPITPTNAGGRTYAFHPALANLQSMFNGDRSVAVVANTGVLMAPTSLAQYSGGTVPLPPNLFSHSDMQGHWQSGNPAAPFSTGWGGRIADRLTTLNGPATMPMSVSLAGTNPWMVASLAAAQPYQLGAAGPMPLRAYRDSMTGPQSPQALFESRIVVPRFNVLEDAYGDIVARSSDIAGVVGSALSAVGSLRADFPGTGSDGSPGADNALADQLRLVACLIAARAQLGVRRQLFFVMLDGFDTHGSESTQQGTLLAQLDAGLGAFYRKTVELGVAQSVTAFTASEFGRTYTSNGSGSDHGWGNHHLVVGGAVRGATLYGSMPVAGIRSNALALVDPASGQSVDVGQGRLLPTTSTDTYLATLAAWFGVGAGDIAAIFPNVGRFPTSNLGFLG